MEDVKHEQEVLFVIFATVTFNFDIQLCYLESMC